MVQDAVISCVSYLILSYNGQFDFQGGTPWVGPSPAAARMPDSSTELNWCLGVTFITTRKFKR